MARRHADVVAAQFADTVLYRFKHIPAIAVRLPDAEAALRLRRLPWVDYVAPGSGLVTPDAVGTCSPLSSPQAVPWNIERVGADDAWAVATGAAAGSLVVMDDGADETNGWHGPELDWLSYTYYVPSTYADGQHGTPVLGAAQANDNTVGTVGVAPDADARVTKIYDGTTGNSQHRAWEVHAASAIDDWAAQAEVMTISYSTKITSPNPPATFVGLHDAIQNAYYQHGVLFTASTGNQGRSDYYAYPAQFAEVIGVGGSDRNDAYTLNNYAPGNVELAAPARDVLTVCKGGAIGEYDGTSFATPMVAGAVMLLREAHPTWSADQVRQRLRDTAVPMANATRSGAGRLDVAAALGIGSPPPDPLAVSLSGPTFLWEGDQGTWTAQVSNASGSVTYRWYKGGALVRTHTTSSTSDAYSTFATFPGFTLEVEVESGGDVAQSSLYVEVERECGGPVAC